ncbi:helix-turn-helix DNA-binding domain protein [Gordonia phage Anon]|nr:helix-turn-helix DNA-binding domain protein [Gordonia phage Anon]
MNATELLDQLREKVEALEEENEALRNQLAIGRRELGFDKVGSSRPNRPKLTRREVSDIRDAYHRGMSQADLARSYDVNPATISRTVRSVYHS